MDRNARGCPSGWELKLQGRERQRGSVQAALGRSCTNFGHPGVLLSPSHVLTPPPARSPGTHPPWHDHGDGLDEPLEGDELVEAEDLAGRHVQPVLWHHPCGRGVEDDPSGKPPPSWDPASSTACRTPKVMVLHQKTQTLTKGTLGTRGAGRATPGAFGGGSRKGTSTKMKKNPRNRQLRSQLPTPFN